MSLLTIVQNVAIRCNIASPVTVVGATDPNISLILNCIQDIGDELVERHDWQALKILTPVTFVGDGTTAAWPLPAGWGSLAPSDTFVSLSYPTMTMVGPANEDDLLRMKSLPVFGKPSCWRVANGQIEFFPVLAAGEVVNYVFQQNTWIVNSAGVPYPNSSLQFDTPQFHTDSDLTLLKERLLMLGAIQLFKRRRGFQYAEEMADFESAFERIAGAESTGREIYMSRSVGGLDSNFFGGSIFDAQDSNY